MRALPKKIFISVGSILVLLVIIVYLTLNETDDVFETCSIIGYDDIETINFKKHKKVTVAASSLYESSILKDLIQGENYRDAWSTPVEVPIAFLDTLKGGLTIVKEGGGKQTHSLRLKSKNGTLYTLRSINKDPQPLIPEFARTLGLENIIVDGISAQHPYAAPVVAQLAEKANLLHTSPKVYFVPKQEALNNYNLKYGNRLYLLEYEPEGEINWTHFNNVDLLVDTEDLQQLKMKHESKLAIDQKTLIRARLFDLIIGDWDRHAKQWGWVVKREKDSSLLAIPIPADRDNAFFMVDGLIPNIISNKNVVEEVRPFDDDINYMKGLVYDFDIYFLKTSHPEDFILEAKRLQKLLTDDHITSAFKEWNQELYDLHANDIIIKLKKRRDDIVNYAIEFKNIIDQKPWLTEPLKGTDLSDIDATLIPCFDCDYTQ